MPICDVCGASFDVDGYHVATGGRLFDSIECAQRALGLKRRRVDATSLWIEAGRRRLGVDDDPTNVERKPSDH
jgi:hypothetical protein